MTLSSASSSSSSSSSSSQLIERPAVKVVGSDFYALGRPENISAFDFSGGFVLGGAGGVSNQGASSLHPSGFDTVFEPLHRQLSSHLSSVSGASTDSQTVYSSQVHLNRGAHMGFDSRQLQSWAENSSRTETSTDLEGDTRDGTQMENGMRREMMAVSGSSDHDRGKSVDSKVLRRLAQNREAARKSRLRKKAYVQQLESSRVKLNQMEQELERVRQQGMFLGGHGGGDQARSGAFAFDMEYARWVEDQNRHVSELRAALTAHMSDNELRALVDNGMVDYNELFRIKSNAVKADVFHIVSGMWRTPAERCFMWMGGFRPSELIKLLSPQLEPLTEQQVLAVCSLQQSSQQAEDALSQGMEALQQSLSETLSVGSSGAPNVANYMGQMAVAMGKLGTLENFVHQADNLRQQTLQQMQRILTTRQAARGLLAMGDYFSRLRALSSLWVARPRE